MTCLPTPYKLSILGDIWRDTILPFSSSKYFYSWLRLSNLVDLSFEYLNFSNKRKTILFASTLTFLQLLFSGPLFFTNERSSLHATLSVVNRLLLRKDATKHQHNTAHCNYLILSHKVKLKRFLFSQKVVPQSRIRDSKLWETTNMYS